VRLPWQKEEIKKVQVDWKEAKKEHQRMMILADPGMGKSTLLRMEAVTVAREELERLDLTPQPPSLRGKGELERGKGELERGKGELEESFPSALGRELLPPASGGLRGVKDVVFPLYLRLSELAEAKGGLIDIIPQIIAKEYPQSAQEIGSLLKDKLAEGKCLLLLDALDEVPKEKREKLKEKLQQLARQSPNKIYITSRIVGYGGNFLSDAKEVEIVPFSQPKIEQYIETWFVNAAEYLTDNSVSAGGLIEELRQKPQINGLAQNPLLLSLICSLYQEKELVLPARRSQLYKTAVNYMLNQWRTQHSHQQPDEGWLDAKLELLEWLAYQMSCEGKEVISLRDLRKTIDKFLQSDCGSDFQDKAAAVVIQELTEEDGIIQKFHEEGDKYLFLHRTFQEYFTACYLQQQIQRDFPAGLELVKAHWWDYDWYETISLLGGLLADVIPLLEAMLKEKDDIFSSLLILSSQCLSESREQHHPLINEIVERLYQLWHRYPNLEFTQSAVVTLVQNFSAMVKCLEKALGDSDEDVRWQAVEALVKIGNPEVIPTLITALGDSDKYVRREAVEALGEIGTPEAVSGLITALEDSDEDVRRKAAEALGEIGTPEAVSGLITALEDSDEDVRRKAAKALGEIGTPEAVSGLITALGDSDDYVRLRAVHALGKIGTPEAVSGLITALGHSDEDVRLRAVHALGKIGNPETLQKILQNPQINLDDSDIFPYIRRLGIRAQKAKPKPNFIPVYPEVVERMRKEI
jgi:hypothetical protein